MCLFYNHHWKIDLCTLKDSQDVRGHVLSYASDQCPEEIGRQWAKYWDSDDTVDTEVFLQPEDL